MGQCSNIETEFYPNGSVKTERWFKNDKLHRSGDLPAVIEYYDSGEVKQKSWFKHGILFRHIGSEVVNSWYKNEGIKFRKWIDYKYLIPCVHNIHYYPNGNKKLEEHKFDDTYYSANDEPGYAFFHENGIPKMLIWYSKNNDGQIHRMKNPAIINRNENGDILLSEWFENGLKISSNKIDI